MNSLGWLSGYRTLIGGIGLIGLGVYQITQGQVEEGVQSLGLGFAAIGIGGKLDKTTEATKVVAEEVKTVATEVQVGAEEAEARGLVRPGRK